MRDLIFAALLACAGLLVVLGVNRFSEGAALVAAGVLLAGWSYLVFVVGGDG